MFKGILITKDESGYQAAVQQNDDAVLPEGDVTVRVEWSTLNYKDGLALTGKAPVVRRLPLVPGIDLAGAVGESSDPAWKAGDRVVLNGWGVGETHCGGLAEVARVKGEWLVQLPAACTARHGDGDRHGRLHGDALRDGAGTARHPAGRRRDSGHGGHWRRRRRGRRASGETRLHGGRVDRPSRRSRTSENAGRDRGHRAWRTIGAGQAAGQGALGRRRAIRWAARRWPMAARRRTMAARWRLAAWPAAWIYRRRWRRSSCAA